MTFTYLMKKQDAIEFVNGLELTDFDEINMEFEDEYVTVTIADDEEAYTLFVEGITSVTGHTIYHNTDIILIDKNVPSNIAEMFVDTADCIMAIQMV